MCGGGTETETSFADEERVNGGKSNHDGLGDYGVGVDGLSDIGSRDVQQQKKVSLLKEI